MRSLQAQVRAERRTRIRPPMAARPAPALDRDERSRRTAVLLAEAAPRRPRAQALIQGAADRAGVSPAAIARDVIAIFGCHEPTDLT